MVNISLKPKECRDLEMPHLCTTSFWYYTCFMFHIAVFITPTLFACVFLVELCLPYYISSWGCCWLSFLSALVCNLVKIFEVKRHQSAVITVVFVLSRRQKFSQLMGVFLPVSSASLQAWLPILCYCAHILHYILIISNWPVKPQ